MTIEAARAPRPPRLESELEGLHSSAWGWALVCCRWDRDQAEEVLQTAYLKAIDGRARFDGRSGTRTWFFGVVKNTARESRRSTVSRVVHLRNWLVGRPADDPVPTPEKLSGEAQQRRRLNRSLGRLSSRQREMLHLVFYQELTIEDAARVLGLKVGTARTHYERGKRRLRTMLVAAGDRR